MKTKYYGGQPPWKSLPFPNADSPAWLTGDDSDRAGAYDTYESMYWSEDNCFTLRVIVTEQPIYISNPRILVDTVAHYLLKGLTVSMLDPDKYPKEKDDLEDFLERQMFYPRFHTAKHGGCIHGDFALHLTADPRKPEGQRISLTSVHPGKIVREFDDDDGDSVTEAWIVEGYTDPDNPDKNLCRRLHYWYDDGDGDDQDGPGYDPDAPADYEMLDGIQSGGRRVMSEEVVLEVDDDLWGDNEKVYLVLNEPAALPDPIDCIPIYWFKNIPMDGQPFGSSDLRGFERAIRGISQEATDLGVAMALDGLGAYVTDATRPKNDQGAEINWSIEPGQILELQNGTYFKRVEGIKSVTPLLDAIKYQESKIYQAGGVSSVAMGDVDSQTASNPMALAIKFLPTLAKITERDAFGIGRLKNLFWDWTKWRQAFEDKVWPAKAKLSVKIGEKLPMDRTARVNELNNMLDRDIISKAYYRSEMENLGFEFPDDIEEQIEQEREEDLKYNVPAGQLANVAAETAAGAAETAPGGQGDPDDMPQGVNGQKSTTLPKPASTSNNSQSGKVNESSGTEASHPVAKQARGARPTAAARRSA